MQKFTFNDSYLNDDALRPMIYKIAIIKMISIQIYLIHLL